MTTTAKFKVSKNILKWVMDESESMLNEKWSNKIKSWINDDDEPTFNQISELSKKSKIPFGYFFLDNPPKMAPQLLNFRTINNDGIQKPSKELIDTIYEMQEKVSWLNDYRKQQGLSKIPFVGMEKEYKNFGPDRQAEEILRYFNIDKIWNQKHKNKFKFIRNVIDDYGISTILNGSVRSTRRQLNQQEFRAFVITDEYAPLIFINSRDSFNAKLFSLIHELVHIWYGQPELMNFNFQENPEYNDKISEQEINKVVENILLPKKYFMEFWNGYEELDSLEKIAKISKYFGVSQVTSAIRAKNLKLIKQSFVDQVKRNLENEYKENIKANRKKPGGPNYYVTLAYKLDNNFSNDVMRSVQSGNTSYTKAFDLLNVKGTKGLNQLSKKLRGKEL